MGRGSSTKSGVCPSLLPSNLFSWRFWEVFSTRGALGRKQKSCVHYSHPEIWPPTTSWGKKGELGVFSIMYVLSELVALAVRNIQGQEMKKKKTTTPKLACATECKWTVRAQSLEREVPSVCLLHSEDEVNAALVTLRGINGVSCSRLHHHCTQIN